MREFLYIEGAGMSAAEGTGTWGFEGPEAINLEPSRNTDFSIGGADMYSLWDAGTSSICSAEMFRVFEEVMTWSWVPGRACVGDIVLFCIELLSCIDSPQKVGG